MSSSSSSSSSDNSRKRKFESTTSKSLIIKKQRDPKGGALIKTQKRTSALTSPIMQLEGHGAQIYALNFSGSGNALASASFDKEIFLWKVYGGCDNYGVLKGHKQAVTQVQWGPGDEYLFSSSIDKTCAVWNHETGQCHRRLRGHEGFVHDCFPGFRGEQQLVSAGEDKTARVWDIRSKEQVNVLQHVYQVTSVTFSKDMQQVFTANLDGVIRCWDLRKGEVVYDLEGHKNLVTRISLSPDGSKLLSNSLDNTVKIWDVQAYAPDERVVCQYMGASHNFEKMLIGCAWSPDGKKIAAGSADRFVYVWGVDDEEGNHVVQASNGITSSNNIMYKLPGHKGTVTDVAFHPKEPIIGSSSSDKTIYLGELAVDEDDEDEELTFE